MAEEKIKYDNDMTTERDILNQIDYAREQGRELGAAQRNAEISRAMPAKGFDSDTVADLTGLDTEAINAR